MVRVVLRPRTNANLHRDDPDKTHKKTKAERQKEYRQRIKNDSERYKEFCLAEASRKRAERKRRTPEQKKHYAELSCLRTKKYYKKLKEQGVKRATKSKNGPTTRKAVEESREKNRDYKAKERENWSSQKRRRVREYDRKRKQRASEAQSKPDAPLTPPPVDVNPDQAEDEPQSAGYLTDDARRQAVYRVRKSLPKDPVKFAQTIKELVEKAPPESKAALSQADFTLGNKSAESETAMVSEAVKLLDAAPQRSKELRAARMLLVANAMERYKNAALRKTFSHRYLKKVSIINSCKTAKGIATTALDMSKRKKRCDALPEETETSILSFYHREDNARQLPNMKSVRRDLQGRMVLEKRLVDMHSQWQNKNPDKKCGLSKFASIKPRHIITLQKTPHDVCMCETCVNGENLVQAIDKACRNLLGPDVITSFKTKYTFCAAVTCQHPEQEMPEIDCIDGKCDKCGEVLLKALVQPLLTHPEYTNTKVTWEQWTKEEYQANDGEIKLKKTIIAVTDIVSVAYNALLNKLDSFRKHLFEAWWQHRAYNSMLKHLGPTDALAVMDYAENYTITFQREIQSAHWTKTQVTIHPVVFAYRCKTDGCKEMVRDVLIIVSNDLKHDSHAVNKFRQEMVAYLKTSMGTSFDNLIEWSDGCAAQYKSKTPFADISFAIRDFGIHLEHHYFGSGHGKGPCDGEGGVVKQAARRAVLSRKAIVTDAPQFFELCKDILSKDGVHPQHFRRSFIYIEVGDINRDRPDRDVLRGVPGTRDVHAVKCIKPGVLATCRLSPIPDPGYQDVGPYKTEELKMTLMPEPEQNNADSANDESLIVSEAVIDDILQDPVIDAVVNDLNVNESQEGLVHRNELTISEGSIVVVASAEELEPYYLFKVEQGPHILKEDNHRFPIGTEVICGYFYKRKLKGRSEHEYEREGKDGDVVVSCNSVLAVDPPVDYNGDKIKVPTEVHLALVELT